MMATRFEDIYGPLQDALVDDLMVVGQIGQSLDGRIATPTGHSHYINGAAGLTHLHRLRSIVDVVLVGIGTALADDPQLTVRRIEGRSPARAVVDPGGRLPGQARLLAADGVRRIVITAQLGRADLPAGVEVLTLPAGEGRISPVEILAALAKCGFRKVLVEGGADTVSRFLTAGCLDRLHVVVAPVILGCGRPSFVLADIEKMDQALRPPMKIHQLDDEVLFDIDLSAHRISAGRAKKST